MTTSYRARFSSPPPNPAGIGGALRRRLVDSKFEDVTCERLEQSNMSYDECIHSDNAIHYEATCMDAKKIPIKYKAGKRI